MYRDQEQRNFARQLRNEATPAEVRLWHFLEPRGSASSSAARRAIGAYIVDFVCFSHRLIVELDGRNIWRRKVRSTMRGGRLGSVSEGFG